MSFMPGPWELLIVLAIVLVIFGAGKLPRVMGDLAKGVKTFKAGIKDDEKLAAQDKDKEQIAKSEAVAPDEAGAKAGAETDKKKDKVADE
jgi:sec-independent protein translocase protein TatA